MCSQDLLLAALKLPLCSWSFPCLSAAYNQSIRHISPCVPHPVPTLQEVDAGQLHSGELPVSPPAL